MTDQKAETQLIDKLLKDISEGSKSALASLYSHAGPAVYAYALSVLKSPADAEDVMQDVFMDIFRSAESYKSRGSPMSWIISITKNRCLMKLRHDRLRAVTPFEPSTVEEAVSKEMTPEEKAVLKACLEELSDEERQIVIMHALFGLKHREISGILDIPLPTVLSKYSRAIKKLRKSLL